MLMNAAGKQDATGPRAMTDLTTEFAELCDTFLREGAAAVLRQAEGGANLNAQAPDGTPFLHWLMSMIGSHQRLTSKERVTLITTLLDLGADPHVLDGDGNSILLEAVLDYDLAMLKLLLERGVDPNCGCGEPFETLYDFALFDFDFEFGAMWTEPVSTSLAEDRADADVWLRRLDREAQLGGCRRPDYLFLLRRHGAQTSPEMARGLGGKSSDGIVWHDGQWRLKRNW